MSLFNRSYLLTITNPPKFEPDPDKNYLEQLSDFVILTPRSVEAFNVTELRVSAKVRTSTSNSNSAYTEIMIYNATEEIRAKLRKPNAYVTLSAGYSKNILTGEETTPEELPNIFSGEVIDSFTRKEDADFITIIRAKDSEVAKRDSYISAIYLGGENISDILTDIVNRFLPKVSIGRLELGERSLPAGVSGPAFLPKQVLNNPYLAYGKVRDVLDELAKDFGFIWYIVGNKFYAQPPNFGRAREVIEIEPNNVINDLSPANGTNHAAKAQEVKAGLKFKVFLNGKIDLSKYIRVSGFSEDKNGDYKIIDLQHILDTRGQDWYTEVTVEGV